MSVIICEEQKRPVTQQHQAAAVKASQAQGTRVHGIWYTVFDARRTVGRRSASESVLVEYTATRVLVSMVSRERAIVMIACASFITPILPTLCVHHAARRS